MVVDFLGRIWNIPSEESCPMCGQLDIYGDCNHNKISDEQYNDINPPFKKIVGGGDGYFELYDCCVSPKRYAVIYNRREVMYESTENAIRLIDLLTFMVEALNRVEFDIAANDNED